MTKTAMPINHRIAALALAVGIACTAAPGVAWADTGSTDSTSSAAEHSTSAASSSADKTDAADKTAPADKTGPAEKADPADKADETEADKDDEPSSEAAEDSGPKSEDEAAEIPESTAEETPEPSAAPQTESAEADNVGDSAPSTPKAPQPTTSTDTTSTDTTSTETAPADTASTHAVSTEPVAVEPVSAVVGVSAERSSSTSLQRVVPVESAAAETTEPRPTAAVRALVAVTAAAVETTTPVTPEPLSPIAELLQLPGRIINVVLQLFGFTQANGVQSPITLAPINDLLFAVFRGIEQILGLDRTPAVQQVVPALTYTGPTDVPTPTVAQFLNAATAEYGLGTVPDDLVPFTVNGFQMASVNILTGMSASAWVTPERQIIIAYQGTTGGTNLLFNPLIAVGQLLTDLQVIFTDSTPLAFHEALNFARRVELAADAQGYGPGDIFVTGHSLGGWEAEYVAQQTGWGGIGFESPGINTTVPGNGANSLFVNVETYGDPAAYMSTDLPGLQPFMPAYVAGGGSKPHYGSIVLIGDPNAMTPLVNAAGLWGKGLLGSLIFIGDFLGNFFGYHLPGIQAYHLGVTPDPGVVTWLGTATGRVDDGYGELTITELLQAASDAGQLVAP